MLTAEQQQEILCRWVPEAVQSDPVLRDKVKLGGTDYSQPKDSTRRIYLTAFGEGFSLQFNGDKLQLTRKGLNDRGWVDLGHPDFQEEFCRYLKRVLALWFRQRYLQAAKRANTQLNRCEWFGGSCEPPPRKHNKLGEPTL